MRPFTWRLKKSLSPASRVFQLIEYSGPSSSALSRSPAPTKLQLVVASPITVWPSSVWNSSIRLAKSSLGAFR